MGVMVVDAVVDPARSGRRCLMSLPGRPKGEFLSAQREATPVSAPPGRPQRRIPAPTARRVVP